MPPTEGQYWERGPIFAALNINKKGLTLDLQSEGGRDLLRQLVATCDVVVENSTPRVLEQLGLDYEALRAERPDLIMLRMPGFGLDGPWRDRSAFAFVIEDASGLTWLTGHPDLLPYEPYCVGDSNAGLHALFGLLLALEHRERTGEGGLVEAAMVDAALNVTCEQVIEHSAYGALLTRAGNRGPCGGAPEPLPGRRDRRVRPRRLLGGDRRSQRRPVAVVATGPGQPTLGQEILDSPPRRPRPRAGPDRRAPTGWCRSKSADEVVELLWSEGVPVGKVLQPHRQPELAQLEHRRFFEEVDHPVLGRSRYSTLPIRFSRGPDRWLSRHAPAAR